MIIVLYVWGLAERVSCTDAEKTQCQDLIEELLEQTSRVQNEGLLCLEETLQQIPRGFLHTALQLTVANIEPDVMREILEKRILLSDIKGVALLRRIIQLEFAICLTQNYGEESTRTMLNALLDIDRESVPAC